MLHSLLQLEDATEFVVFSILFLTLDCAWWWYPLLLFTPDLGMLGYLASTRVGALTYNIMHHKTTGWLVAIIGIVGGFTVAPYALPFKMAGFILLAHSSMDRMLGYGLKHADSFHHTHLGWRRAS
jgi:Domain of unknown function (DUF4260)